MSLRTPAASAFYMSSTDRHVILDNVGREQNQVKTTLGGYIIPTKTSAYATMGPESANPVLKYLVPTLITLGVVSSNYPWSPYFLPVGL